jgi:hypothetical protein
MISRIFSLSSDHAYRESAIADQNKISRLP